MLVQIVIHKFSDDRRCLSERARERERGREREGGREGYFIRQNCKQALHKSDSSVLTSFPNMSHVTLEE